MHTSLKSIISKSLTDLKSSLDDPNVTDPLTKWVTEWPGQAVLTAMSIHWTTEVSEAIVKNGNSLNVLYDKWKELLEEVVVYVRRSGLSSDVLKVINNINTLSKPSIELLDIKVF